MISHFKINGKTKVFFQAPENTAYFWVIRAVKSEAINFIPNEFISDYHLDSYVVEMFSEDGDKIGSHWMGTDKFNWIEDKLFPIKYFNELKEKIENNTN